MKTRVSAMVLFLIAVGSATAQTAKDYKNTANFLAGKCKNWDTSGSFEAGYCVGFITGVDSQVENCPGDNVTRGQVLKVALKYMDDHPEELDQAASTVVRRALLKAFPCPK
jgi:Rap1a immunity proteins